MLYSLLGTSFSLCQGCFKGPLGSPPRAASFLPQIGSVPLLLMDTQARDLGLSRKGWEAVGPDCREMDEEVELRQFPLLVREGVTVGRTRG